MQFVTITIGVVNRVRKPSKRVVNDASRSGLPPFEVAPIKARLARGIDVRHLNRLADQLEDEAILRKLRKTPPRRR